VYLLRLSAWFLLAGLCLSLPLKAELAWQPPADIASAFLLSVNGKTVWQSNADKRLPPASLTKLVGALVLAENANLKDWVTISNKAANQTGTQLHLKKNEQFRAAHLLGAMLIRSANDACMAMAEWDAGTEAAFVKKMNAKVAQLQLKNTHFDNACGFDGANHYSTASDLAAIAQAANNQPKIKVWTDMQNFSIQSKAEKTYSFVTSNLLLGRVEGVDGLKTGFTQKAGKCLIAHGKRNKKTVFLVMLNAPDRWWNADELLNRAFDDATIK
jgi:serine-type D-Ala-D-Ala carboxypeptidase (penicillin-binding protein 5/6)